MKRLRILNNPILPAVIGIVIVLLFDLLSNVTRNLAYGYNQEIIYNLIEFFVTGVLSYSGYVIVSQICYWNSKYHIITFNHVMKAVIRLFYVILPIFLIVQLCGIYFGNTYYIGYYFFFIYIFLLFPSLCGMVQKELKIYDEIDYIAVVKVILISNLIAYIFLYEIDYTGILFMPILQVMSVITLVMNQKKKNTKSILLVSVLYTVWCFLIAMIHYHHNSITYVNLFLNYKKNIPQILYVLRNASIVGNTPIFTESNSVGDVISFGSNQLCMVLYYFGWLAMLGYITLLVILMVVLYICLGNKYRIYKPFYYVYQSIYIYFVIRCILGVLYILGVGFLPASFPISGDWIDVSCVILLLCSQYENMSIQSELSKQKHQTILNEEGMFYFRLKRDGLKDKMNRIEV
ncbi:MAG: hypothetical protein R3Y24_05380 [Eubacteriales bacterium]